MGLFLQQDSARQRRMHPPSSTLTSHSIITIDDVIDNSIQSTHRNQDRHYRRSIVSASQSHSSPPTFSSSYACSSSPSSIPQSSPPHNYFNSYYYYFCDDSNSNTAALSSNRLLSMNRKTTETATKMIWMVRVLLLCLLLSCAAVLAVLWVHHHYHDSVVENRMHWIHENQRSASRREMSMIAGASPQPQAVPLPPQLLQRNQLQNQSMMMSMIIEEERQQRRVPIDSCQFRPYPPHRYYHLNSIINHNSTNTTTTTTTTTLSENNNRWNFLVQDHYIYGEWPQLLRTQGYSRGRPTKVCVNQSAWRSNTSRYMWPFADGTNPSILSLERIREGRQPVVGVQRPVSATKDRQMTKASTSTKEWLAQLLSQHPQPSSRRTSRFFLATACMTHSQCVWQSPTPSTFSNATRPTVILTTLLLLDDQFQTLYQTTIHLERDAARWGRHKIPSIAAAAKNHIDHDDSYYLYTPALDDARLFVHEGHVWITFREGRRFGYETQVLNPLHLSWSSMSTIQATIRASESASICCGRNMALLESVRDSRPRRREIINDTSTKEKDHKEEDNSIEIDDERTLRALAWVDPVTIISVDLTSKSDILSNSQTMTTTTKQHKQQRSSSHVHGTNGFMVYLPHQKEYLGIAHLHRPHDREANEYARFGHHYTHAFFTIAESSSFNASTTSFTLKSLSPEFVFPQAYSPSPGKENTNTSSTFMDPHPPPDDAEIIQFASGLELIHDGQDEDIVVIAYGINDCEAGIVTLPLDNVLKLLRPVPTTGMQVVDFMYPLLEKYKTSNG